MYMLCFIGGMEIIVVLLVALLFFGAKSIPEIARMLGKGMREFRKATEEIKREFNDETGSIRDDFNDLNNKLKN